MIVFDIESSGQMLGKHNSSIVSLGAIDFANPDNTFYEECYIREGAEIDDGALKVNGFTREEITDTNKLSEAELIQKFYQWSTNIEERTLAGQVPMNDINILVVASQLYDIPFPFGYRTVDLHTTCYLHAFKNELLFPVEEHKSSNLGLDNILDYVGLQGRPGAHNALDDAQLTAEAFSRLIDGVSLLPEFAQFPVPEYLVQ